MKKTSVALVNKTNREVKKMKTRWALLTISALAIVLIMWLFSGIAAAAEAKLADPTAFKAVVEAQVNQSVLDDAQVIPNGDNGVEPTDDVPPDKNDDYDGPKVPPKNSGEGSPSDKNTPKTDTPKEKTPETKETPKTRKTLPYTGGDSRAYIYLGAVTILVGTALLERRMIVQERKS